MSGPDLPLAPATTPALELTPELRAQFDALRAQYPAEMTPSLVLPLLHCAQAALPPGGCLGEAEATMIAGYLGIAPMPVLEALSWYTMFHKQPVGRHVVKVCRNIACALRGADPVIAHLQRRLGLQPGQTSADGRFTLLTVECLASCGTAPAMQVNDTYHENLDTAKVDAILEGLR